MDKKKGSTYLTVDLKSVEFLRLASSVNPFKIPFKFPKNRLQTDGWDNLSNITVT
jgi:hypothetical protein